MIQEAVAVTTAIQEEILKEMGVGKPCLFDSLYGYIPFLIFICI